MSLAANQPESSFRLALISMPWPAFNRPSIQLGSLKSYLATQDPSIKIDAFHPYLEIAQLIGTQTYHWISQNVWVCEALYSSILFPEQLAACRTLVDQTLRKKGPDIKFDFDEIHCILKGHLARWATTIDWNLYGVIGFSVCLNQLLASLAAAKAVKEQTKQPILFGGSSCYAELAKPLFSHFSVDFMISGEGEQPLLNLCQYLAGITASTGANIFTPSGPNKIKRDESGQMDSLYGLPMPDYDDYFRTMGRLFTKNPFIPVLPLEFSRGCWWGKCTFCNLNLQWQGYRAKSASQMGREVLSLSEKYGCLDFCFTDNVLPVKKSAVFFDKMATLGRDIRFFAEIRASQRGKFLAMARKGGLNSIQAGIEALSNRLLKRLKKGTNVIDNLAIMKDGLENRVLLDGNLIIEFPGSSRQEVEETLANLDFAMPFHPLSTASFFLGHGSPVDKDPAYYSILAKTQHPQNKKLFPAKILHSLTLLIKGYRGDRVMQRQQWAPVVRKVEKWRRLHQGRNFFQDPFLSYRDGGDFLIIRQEIVNGDILHHRLRSLSGKIYLACKKIRTVDSLLTLFPAIKEKPLLNFLDDLVAKKIMFRQDKKYLALAVHKQ